VNQTGVLYGLDIATGEEQFARRISGSIWATPLGMGERVYFFGQDGRVDVLAAEGDSDQVSTWSSLPRDPAPPRAAGDGPPVGGSVLYAAALADDLMLLRCGDRLFAFPLSTSPTGG
jgi:outer membrane protein assembly factor BamB